MKIKTFTGYDKLLTLNLKKSATRILSIYNCQDLASEYATDDPVKDGPVQDFVSFCETKYFTKDGFIVLIYDGQISSQWNLQDGTIVVVDFHGTKKVTLMISAKEFVFKPKIKLDSLPRLLKRFKIPSS